MAVDYVDKGAVKRRLDHLQESCSARRRRVPANVLEMFTLAKDLVEQPVAGASEAMDEDVVNNRVTLADALHRAREGGKKLRLSPLRS